MGIPFDLLGRVFARWGHRTYPSWAWPLLARSLEALPRGARVLDLGGGTGVLSRAALTARADLKPVIADPARGMLRHAPEPAEVVVARAEALPFADAEMDAVLVGEALHHFQDPQAALAEIARVLKPGGLLWIYEFDPRRGVGRWVYWGERLLGEPAHFFTPEALLRSLRVLGFEGDYRERQGRYVLTARLRGERRRAAARPA
ncbi:methyltransferase domain-containing protein [Oceanithermus sp.]|uniref:class I SAM-dependent methyltransferase n=1 Tax=Oceanithermus sp. TaxID=2268145 RepID=UPI00257C92B7|nr:methyltransferase domain-containing protein [Oceanithermus sp.]